MGQTADPATLELPDPLENTGENAGQAQSADDLLSQLAGDEIDRLLAESGDEAGAAQVEVKSEPPAAPAVRVTQDIKKSPLEEEMDLDAAINAAALERSAIRNAPSEAVQETGPHIELGDAFHRLPFFLRPLEWLSAPLDPWPDQIRDLLGKVGILTLVNAVAVITYVIIFRRHHH